MRKIFTFLIYLLFPPSKEELLLLSIPPQDFSMRVPIAPPSPFPYITPLFAYKDPLVKELIWHIKYKKNKHALQCAAFALHGKLKDLKIEKAILIPIPISKKRRRERGFNQCELIVDEILKLDEIQMFKKNFDLLQREKHIERQTLKGRNERIENAKNIFIVNEKESTLVDKNELLIIIDDVLTTGSTLKEARETFLKAGYVNVKAFSVAH